MDEVEVMTDVANEAKGELPLVTFVLFAYNQEKYIREAVEGAFSQTYSPLEIIMSDDYSSDRTFEIMQEMAAGYAGPHTIILRRNEQNEGVAGHINNCLSLAQGQIVTWAAGDDVSLDGRTQTLIDPMLADSKIIATHSSVIEIDVDGREKGLRDHSAETRKPSVKDVCRYGRSIVSQSHAFRRVVFDRFGPLRADLTNEGPAMAFREALLGDIEYIERPVTKYRIGSGVSTYSGKERKRRQNSEPLKISNWKRTAFLQMRDDLERLSSRQDKALSVDIEKNIRFYTNLFSINSRKHVLRSIVENMRIYPGDFSSVRAAFRVLLPGFIYERLS